MLSGNQLDNALQTIPTRPHFNRAYGRVIHYRHAGDMLGRGRPITNQRFNKTGGARVIYLAENYLVALNETQAIGGALLSTRILLPVNVNLNSVIDLRDPGIQTLLSTNIDEITLNFRPLNGNAPTQLLGEACALSARIDGLLFPSAINQSWTNLAVFEAQLAAMGFYVEIDDPPNGLSERLP